MSDIDWSQYKPGDLVDFKLTSGQEFTGERIDFIHERYVALAPGVGLDGNTMDFPKGRFDWVRLHVPPLQPGDGGHDAKEGLPFWIDKTMHLWTVTPFGEAVRWTLMSLDDPLLVWTRRGGVQVKQP